MKNNLLFLSILLSVFIFGCNPPPKNNHILAKINNYEITLDEFEFHPYAEQNYAEIKPMIDAGGKRKLIIGSAPNVLNDASKFKELWHGAKAGTNNFAYRFWGYDVIPYRDDAWYEERKKEYDPLELATRYPRTEEEALSSTADLCRFDVETIKSMILDARTWKPIEERYNGIVKIYKRPIAGEKYCFTIDPSEGGYDPSVGFMTDWRSNEEVAEFHGKISADEQARIVWELYQEYNQPFTAVERNADGRRLIDKLLAYGVKNWFYTSKDKPGWWTSATTRPVMIGDLAEMVFKRGIRIYNPVALSQFLTFIRTPQKPEGIATKGTNDDYVMAIAIGQQIRKSMPSGSIKFSHWKYNG